MDSRYLMSIPRLSTRFFLFFLLFPAFLQEVIKEAISSLIRGQYCILFWMPNLEFKYWTDSNKDPLLGLAIREDEK